MSVTDVICALECKIAYYTKALINATIYGNRPVIKGAKEIVDELILLKFLVKYNNFSENEECFDNCELNKKLECYGLSWVY